MGGTATLSWASNMNHLLRQCSAGLFTDCSSGAHSQASCLFSDDASLCQLEKIQPSTGSRDEARNDYLEEILGKHPGREICWMVDARCQHMSDVAHMDGWNQQVCDVDKGYLLICSAFSASEPTKKHSVKHPSFHSLVHMFWVFILQTLYINHKRIITYISYFLNWWEHNAKIVSWMTYFWLFPKQPAIYFFLSM